MIFATVMAHVDAELKERVYELVGKTPYGLVVTYGQVATLCGAPWAAWEVGQIAHNGPTSIPWHRVVNKQGYLARGWPSGGTKSQSLLLKAEGIEVSQEFKVNLGKYLWKPNL